jgi:hypothetical protein
LFRRRADQSPLLSAWLYLALAEPLTGTPGTQALTEDTEFNVRCVVENGFSYLPFFTSEEALLRSLPEGSPWISLRGRDALQMFLSGEWDAIVINHRSDDAYVLSREEVGNLLVADADRPPGMPFSHGS